MIFISSALVVSSSCGMELSQLLKKEINSNNSPVSQLIKAIEFNAFDTCKSIIEKYPDAVNGECAPSNNSYDLCTPLHIAVDRDNVPAAQLLLTHKALINAQTKQSQLTSLHMIHSKEMAKLLLCNGANLHSRDRYGRVLLHHVLFECSPYTYNLPGRYDRPQPSNQYEQYKSSNRYDIAHYLLKKGVDSNEVIDEQGNSLLHIAVHNSIATQLLLRHNANPESKSLKGENLIGMIINNWPHYKSVMAQLSDKRIIFFPLCEHVLGDHVLGLLQNGAKKFKNLMLPGRAIKDKKKAEDSLARLFMMLQQGDNDSSQGEKIIEYRSYGYLFNNASFTDLEMWVGQEGIDYVKEHLSNRCQEALIAADKGQDELLERMVIEHPFVLAYDKEIAFQVLCRGIVSHRNNMVFHFLNQKIVPDVNVVRNSLSLLAIAIGCKNAASVALLIKNNSVVTSYAYGMTIIDLLYHYNDQESIEAFYNAFADNFFSTYSYQAYYQEIKKILKTSKFDINYRDKKGETLLHRAAKFYPEKCSLLLKYGARVTQHIIDSAQSEKVRAILQKKYDKQEQYK